MNIKSSILISILIVALCAALELSAPAAHSHPGRLDKNGCHQVSRDWKYKSGVVLKAGTVHCHRGMDKMKFDGKELLEDPDDRGAEVKQKRTIKK